MFKHAIVRKPGKNFSEGTTTANLGMPDYETSLDQHNFYCEALKSCGLNLIVLEPDLRFPDSIFVEDVAVVTDKCAVITNVGNVKRQGEEEKIKEILSKFRNIEQIKPHGTVDGGDVLMIENHFYIGISERTNDEGAKQLSSILSRYSYTSSTVPVKSVLHLKTGMTYIGNNNIISIKQFVDVGEFKKFNIIELNENENYAANCLLVNDTLLIAKGFPKLREKLQSLDYKILEINMSEFQKMDGGLTCLSILF